MTFSIVARDPDTGDLGVAVASKFLAVGAVVPWAKAGVGAIATQAWANVAYGPDGLTRLAGGADAASVVARLTGADAQADQRQLGIVDARGGAASHTGGACLTWAGGRTGAGVAVQGNILVGPTVVDDMLAAFVSSTGPLPGRLLTALAAGDAAGGDARGRQSAAILVVRAGGGYSGGDDRWIDLRVDDHPAPVPELVRLLGIFRLLSERPEPDDLLAIDGDLAAELRQRLARAGWAPGRRDAFAMTVRASMDDAARVGTARDAGPDWDAAWDGALLTWMGVANLEERTAARGWIDPLVLAELRSATT
ncbi:MAG TPA: DUF1028 domain-containing protein [Candidatus Limnocylindrales bacterium]|nr:DUF1028 domain-containing protein [Candidatus Limnocylindrales bacterium]